MKRSTTEHQIVSYVNREGTAAVQCPQCGNSKIVDIKSHRHIVKKFKTNCKCGAFIRGHFESRRFYRKKVRLSGFYVDSESGTRRKIIVENVSLMGVGFTCLRKPNIRKGEQLEISFTLDNKLKSKIKLLVVVLNVQGNFVGTKRCDSHIEQPDLGFYLR